MCWNPRPKIFMGLKNLHIANLDNPLTMKEPPAQRIKFTNLGQSRKLLFATLNEVNCSSQENRVSLCCPREDSLVATEQLDGMLEFQREFNNFMTLFPPPIHLSVYGSDSHRSVNKAATREENHLKVIQDVAESWFRYDQSVSYLSSWINQSSEKKFRILKLCSNFFWILKLKFKEVLTKMSDNCPRI